MFARATSGDKPNNNKFSECSQASMALVMEAKARHTAGCFIGEKLYFYRPQTKFSKVMFSQVSVCPQGFSVQGCLCPGGVSVQEGSSVRGLCPEGFYPGGLCQGDPHTVTNGQYTSY